MSNEKMTTFDYGLLSRELETAGLLSPAVT